MTDSTDGPKPNADSQKKSKLHTAFH